MICPPSPPENEQGHLKTKVVFFAEVGKTEFSMIKLTFDMWIHQLDC